VLEGDWDWDDTGKEGKLTNFRGKFRMPGAYNTDTGFFLFELSFVVGFS